jgi:hypothetical protein
MKTLFSLIAVSILLLLSGCGTSDESLCAEAVDGTEFCYEHRVSKHEVHDYFNERYHDFKKIKNAAGDQAGDTLAYIKEKDAICRKLTSDYGWSSALCNLLWKNSVTEEDVDVILYRFLLYTEGTPAYNFQGRIISKYAPIMNQRWLIDTYGVNKDKDYSSHEEYFRSLYTHCIKQFGNNLVTRGRCADMKTGVELAIAEGINIDIRMLADWYYIAATYSFPTNNAFTPKQSMW